MRFSSASDCQPKTARNPATTNARPGTMKISPAIPVSQGGARATFGGAPNDSHSTYAPPATNTRPNRILATPSPRVGGTSGFGGVFACSMANYNPRLG